MAEPATKDDIERVLSLLHEFANRVDQRFDELAQRMERYARRGDARLQSLETFETGGKERLNLLEKQFEDLSKRVQRLEENPGHAA